MHSFGTTTSLIELRNMRSAWPAPTSSNIAAGPYDPAPKEESVHNIGKEERGGDGSAGLDQMNPPIIMGRR